ncbi:MAG: HD domain-containing protein [Oscillospiraceae bacterium]|nr:HD domain-containing protein [Oscillospiraceae bacterium]
MSNKTEIPVDLEVSGAEALCQTEDGYVWIAQYSGLTRYDSQEFVTYKSFEYDGQGYSVINVRALAAKGNTLYVATSEHVYVYKDHHFEPLVMDAGVILDLILDDRNDLLYISTQDKGGIIYNIAEGTKASIPGTEEKFVRDIALDLTGENYYYQADEGVFDKAGNEILLNSRLLEIYSYGATLYMAEDSGIIHRYDMKNRQELDDLTVPDQVNKMLYSEEEQILFAACEKNGIYCIDFSTGEPVITLAGDLDNKSQLVDLMIDYEGNLWAASHYIGASGVSIITRNALSELLYDDPIWQSLNAPPAFDRNVYAVEKYGDILYIVAAARIYRYDLIKNEILPDNVIMQTIDEYADAKTQEGKAQGDDNFTFTYAPKDVEVFQGKLYFAVSSIGLVEYDPELEEVVIYDLDYIGSHLGTLIDDPDITLTNTIRSMRSFDDYLVLGYTRGIMRFDGALFSVMNTGSNVLYVNKTKDGRILFDRTQGLFVVDDAFTTVTEIPTEKGITGNRLKFLVDGDELYYTLNSRLFRLNTENGNGVSEEIAIPYIKGSIVELAKIRCSDKEENPEYKYVIGSQTQLYITNSLEGDRLTEYNSYDATNGLQPIIANTSGYYDEAEQKYYLQSTNGIFVYDFNLTRDVPPPAKIAVSSVDLDGTQYYGENIAIGKDVYRVAFNLSVLGFRPNNGHTVYYKLDGIDDEFAVHTDDNRSIYYTNLPGGSYDFHIYVTDEYGQTSNRIRIHLEKEKRFYEQWWFWAVLLVIAAAAVYLVTSLIIRFKTRQSLKRQLEYKNITLEAIQAIARTIDAKDEYTNGHSIRVGAYSKLIAENMGMSSDEVDNIYYIALLHDIGKIAIPDSILNKPGRLTDQEFKVMKSHTTRGAGILKGISTIPQIMEGAKSHHEKYDGSGYPEGISGESIPFVARIICCADCFDAMASKRVYKEPFSLDVIIKEFERCSGTQFDPNIAKVIVDLMETGKLKPYAAENTYLGSDGKTHRMKKEEQPTSV